MEETLAIEIISYCSWVPSFYINTSWMTENGECFTGKIACKPYLV